MIKVIAHFYIKPEFVEKTESLFKELVEKSRKDKGCISYELFEVEGDTGHMVFIETWKDKGALDAHSKTEHFVRIIDELTKMSYKEAVVTAMTQKL